VSCLCLSSVRNEPSDVESQSRLVAGGVQFVQKKIGDWKAFLEQTHFDIVFNCVGLGARDLVGDDKMAPIRGQMIRVRETVSATPTIQTTALLFAQVRAPWIKHFYYTGDNAYIIPK
jgi:hypothetical protein